jgi:hypothetical protein
MNVIDDKQFVTTWVEAFNKRRGVAHVAERMNIDHTQASAKANVLRKKGVNLPAMPRGRVGYSVDYLNQVIESKVE